jgi:hypothetical protein
MILDSFNITPDQCIAGFTYPTTWQRLKAWLKSIYRTAKASDGR